MADKYKYIYGPVPSWRLGRSLGIDPISTAEKTCPFNCTYCQLGESVKYETERRVFVPTDEIVNEIASLPDDVEIDFFTFSGRGEPTLARNLGELIEAVRKVRGGPIAVLTDSSLMDRADVRHNLENADLVMAKLDVPNEQLFQAINRPAPGITFSRILEGLKSFSRTYRGRFALQIMFIEANMEAAEDIAKVAMELRPDEVQLNTPLRPSAVAPLGRKEMERIALAFEGLDIVNVYEGLQKDVRPLSTKDALFRRGKRL